MGSNRLAGDTSSDWPQSDSVLLTPIQTDTVWADLDVGDLVHWTLVSLDGRASMQIRRRFVVGSGLCCNLCLAEEGIATHHAMLNFEDGQVYVTPLSDAVTMVDGQKIETRHQLRPDVTLTFGAATFRLRSDLPEPEAENDPLMRHRIPKRTAPGTSRIVRGLAKSDEGTRRRAVGRRRCAAAGGQASRSIRGAAAARGSAKGSGMAGCAAAGRAPLDPARAGCDSHSTPPAAVRSTTPEPAAVRPATPPPAAVRTPAQPAAPRPVAARPAEVRLVTPRRAPRRATPYFRILLALLVLPIGLWLLPTNLLSPDTHPQTALAEPAAPPAAVAASVAASPAAVPVVKDEAAPPGATGALPATVVPDSASSTAESWMRVEPGVRQATAGPAAQHPAGVSVLMDEAANLQAHGSVYAPAGRNAAARYVQVLEMAPNTAEARDRLSKIVGDATHDASELILSQRFEQARQLLGRLSAAIPKNRSTLIDARPLSEWRALDLILEADTLMQNYRLDAPDEPNAVALLREALRIDPNNAIAEEMLAKSFGMLAEMRER